MSTNVRWIVSSSASAFHAAAAIVAGRTLADASLAAALAEPAANLADVLTASRLPVGEFLEHATALSAGVHNDRELASLAILKTIGRSPQLDAWVSPLAAAITALEKAYNAWSPKSIDDLDLRSGPLREQWEARGPGLLVGIGRMTEPELIVSQADVLLVHPALGSAGSAHLPSNSVRIEAVLANPHAALPETVRLAWLLAQLNNDLPRHQGDLPRQRIAELGALALIPPVLLSAQDVELARYDLSTLTLALSAWHVPAPDAAATAQLLDDWWQTYSESRPAWSIGLAALDRMLPLHGSI